MARPSCAPRNSEPLCHQAWEGAQQWPVQSGCGHRCRCRRQLAVAAPLRVLVAGESQSRTRHCSESVMACLNLAVARPSPGRSFAEWVGSCGLEAAKQACLVSDTRTSCQNITPPTLALCPFHFINNQCHEVHGVHRGRSGLPRCGLAVNNRHPCIGLKHRCTPSHTFPALSLSSCLQWQVNGGRMTPWATPGGP